MKTIHHISIGLLVLCLISTAQAQFSYTTSNNQITITGYTGPGGAIIIPGTINGLPVTSIRGGAFQGYSGINLTSVTIPDSVTTIGDNAFAVCFKLTSVIMGNSITSIGQGAFIACTKLASVTIPNTVTSIGNDAFNGCSSLTSMTIPTSVNGIGAGAFEGCGLTSVTIPSSVTSIGINPFGGCTSLTSITVSSQNPVYSSSTDGLLFDKSQSTLIQYPAGIAGSYTIPTSVNGIGAGAFYGCGLTSVTIPGSVTSIASYAFGSCSSLTSITVSSQNPVYSSSMDGLLFDKSQSTLIQYPGGISGSYTIPTSVTGIGAYAFYGCGLTSVTIPSSVTSIASSTFTGSNKLTNITIPTSVTSIGFAAFFGCGNLTSVTIPTSITSIAFSAFTACYKLTSAVFMGNAPSMDSSVFSSTASGFTVYYFNGATGFTSPIWNDGHDSYPAVNMGGYSPVAPWLLSKGFAYNADLTSNPNGDGVSLLMAYALNLDPNQNLASSLPQMFYAANQMSLTFYAGSAGVIYSVETSTNLQTWTTTGVSISGPDANSFSTATIPMDAPCRFMRLKVVY